MLAEAEADRPAAAILLRVVLAVVGAGVLQQVRRRAVQEPQTLAAAGAEAQRTLPAAAAALAS
jgi:hypothetical protein